LILQEKSNKIILDTHYADNSVERKNLIFVTVKRENKIFHIKLPYKVT